MSTLSLSKLLLINTACIVRPGSGSVKFSSVRLSVCPARHSAAARLCGGFAAVGPASSRYRLIAARPALSSKCEQCH